MAVRCKTPQTGEVKFEVVFVPFTSGTFLLPRHINVLFKPQRIIHRDFPAVLPHLHFLLTDN